MRIENLASLPAGDLDADLIIVGAGPAGLSLARELGGAKIKVIVCESGLNGQYADYYPLNQVEAELDHYFDPTSSFRAEYFSNGNPVWRADIEPYGTRVRGYGGSTVFWGGKAAAFDETDFSKRDWVPYSGWPITLSEIEPYLDRAGFLLGLGPNIYDDRLWPRLGKREPHPALDRKKLRTTFWQYSRSRARSTDIVRFHLDHRNIPGENLRTLVNATVTRVDLTSDLRRFESVEVSTLDGHRRQIRGKACVLAASAIENPRLLQASNHQKTAGLGNQNDAVGRYLMDHPGAKIGCWRGDDLDKIVRHFGFYGLQHDHRTQMYMHGFRLSPEVQSEEKLLNAALFALEGVAPDDPFKAVGRLARLKSANAAQDTASALRNAPRLLKGVLMRLFQTSAAAEHVKELFVSAAFKADPAGRWREFQSIGMPHKLTTLDLYSLSEQHPDPASRVTLGQEKDRFGVPQALVAWRLSEFETRTVMRLAQITAEELDRLGLPRPKLEGWIADSRPQEAKLTDMAHPAGTTRMGEDPKTSVVDANCKLHGVDGIYAAGSSVFATSGHANPTLMIAAFAIRLADHLKTKLASL